MIAKLIFLHRNAASPTGFVIWYGERKSVSDLDFIIMVVVLKSDEAKHLHVPHYKTLTIKTILEYASTKDEVKPYLCDDIDIPKLPRSFVCNLVFSICGDDFRLWVSERVKQCHHRDMA